MAVFIDTGIFVAARNRSDLNHRRAVELLRSALKGEYGEMYTSDYVFDEAVTLALIRTKKPRLAIDIGNFILSSRKLKMLFVDRVTFMEAWKIFSEYMDRRISFTDATSIALIKKYNIDYIMSFDKHFDGIIPRIC